MTERIPAKTVVTVFTEELVEALGSDVTRTIAAGAHKRLGEGGTVVDWMQCVVSEVAARGNLAGAEAVARAIKRIEAIP